MRRTYEIDRMVLTVEFLGESWVAKVTGACVALCEHGEEHCFDIDVTVTMDARRCHEDLALLDAYEWAIRGREDAARRVVALITDDEMYRQYFDPCEVDR